MEALENAKRGLQLLREEGMKKINFVCGEPFLYPKFLGALAEFCKRDLQIEGKGAHLRDMARVADLCQKYGIRFKLNTVVNKYNFDEDMDEHITALNPFRWKVFQVLIIEEENGSESTLRDARQFAITEEHFQLFCKTHENHKCLIPESNTVMKSSYLLMDEYMRFINKGVGAPSPSILDVGVMEALRQVYRDAENFHQRGGIYDWSTKTADCSKDPKLDF
ncbi:hypothetical protein LOZ57_000521 [Ophidiomyces ophidiicola]|uniref:uncharacterized protein n=1 Tax=Ophidiomyces ophidiicola TaxID=1387563 RepID=UPI0020C33A27|nr:uncharacterized protein LOZ57_000521 [Ophidiomyces ophidiicola]KAI1954171.1 hypothetical protein LOZ57_000521 [Ophidiomyces ophidiicola]KAI2056965.1 hypothetical protein LOZ43_003333 [Ophidiomyces ophidiicola]KAI2086626.1 hypothetical protein LOZ36_003218 [Ophidiomyces ophidiicola]